jgi:hypothetical protein
MLRGATMLIWAQPTLLTSVDVALSSHHATNKSIDATN